MQALHMQPIARTPTLFWMRLCQMKQEARSSMLPYRHCRSLHLHSLDTSRCQTPWCRSYLFRFR